MEFRRLLHPLPIVLIFLFVAVAVADLVQKLGEVPDAPSEFEVSVTPRFEAAEPVIDFRPPKLLSGVENLPIPELDPEQWSDPERRGVWTRGAAAEFQLALASGGHRTVLLECLPGSGKRPVRTLRLSINGIDCGSVTLAPGWNKYRIPVPEGAIHPGSNRFVFEFPDRDRAPQLRRSLLIRKLGLFLEEGTDVSALKLARPTILDLESERVKIRRSGTLEVFLVLSDWTDALQMRYRFSSGAGRAEVMVARMAVDGAGEDDVLRRSINAEREMSGRVRFPLHGRRGAYVLRIRADLAQPDAQLLISSLRLVEEGDPTRRPWAANPLPN